MYDYKCRGNAKYFATIFSSYIVTEETNTGQFSVRISGSVADPH